MLQEQDLTLLFFEGKAGNGGSAFISHAHTRLGRRYVIVVVEGQEGSLGRGPGTLRGAQSCRD